MEVLGRRGKIFGVLALAAGTAVIVGAGAVMAASGTALAADAAPAAATLPFRDRSLPLDQRVDDLLGRLTVEEKVGQLQNDSHAVPRLGIRGYNVWNEALHGVARDGVATVFPQAIGLAATFDTPLIEKMGDTIAVEARAKYALAYGQGDIGLYQGLTFFSPNINIFRDPRWGRGQETYGEDPFLTGRIGVAFIRGLQGNDPLHLHVGATAKHFAVHSGPELLRHGFDVHPSAHDLEDTYLPAFRAAVTEGHVASVMCVYNAIDGEPGCANVPLLDKTLRGDWKFQGFVTSDCNAISDIFTGHHYVDSEMAAAAAALKAGVDNECTVRFGAHDFDYQKYLDALKAGLIGEKDIDRAVRRVLRTRFALDLFDEVDAATVAAAPAAVDNDAHRAFARQVARESLVLLKNDGTLPLAHAPARIAVVGPLADSQRVLEGNYNGTPSRVVTVMDGIRKQFPGAKVSFEPGTVQFLRAEVPVPATVLSTDDGKPGLLFQSFATPERTGTPLVSRVDTRIEIGNGLESRTGYARWTGWLTPTESGDYRVALPGDRNQLFLDGKPVIDMLGSSTSAGMDFGDIRLEAGHRYAVRIENSPALTRGASFLWFRKDPGAQARAVAAAKDADLVIAVVGITADLEGEESALKIPGFEGGDRTSLDLPAEEQALLEAVKGTGKPLVVVLMSGSGVAVNWAQANANAILQAWYPGEEGGAAVAETLAGEYNPAGRLPVTFYTGVDQLPDFADYSMRGRTYRYFEGKPLYGFGYGLSYTKFSYGQAKLSQSTLAAGQPLEATVTVRNTGKRAGDEVVQAYLVAEAAPGAPRRALRGFQRIHLGAGASQKVTLSFSPRDLSHVDPEGHHVITAGHYRLFIGGGQPDSGLPMIELPFTVTGSVGLPR